MSQRLNTILAVTATILAAISLVGVISLNVRVEQLQQNRDFFTVRRLPVLTIEQVKEWCVSDCNRVVSYGRNLAADQKADEVLVNTGPKSATFKISADYPYAVQFCPLDLYPRCFEEKPGKTVVVLGSAAFRVLRD